MGASESVGRNRTAVKPAFREASRTHARHASTPSRALTDMYGSRLFRLALPLGGALVTAALGLGAYVVHQLNGPRHRTWRDDYTFSPFEVGVEFEDVEFQTQDGLTLRGWWFPHPETKSVVVALSGHKGAKHDLLGIGSGLWRAGNNVLLFDFRGCGTSDAAPLSLAHRELADARAAVAYVRRRMPDARIGLIGFSMGAAVAILTAISDPEITGVVSDSSFAGISEVVEAAYRRHGLPARILVPIADALNRWRHGYTFSSVRPVDVISRLSPRPVLIIHGADDAMTPVEQANRLYEAAVEPKDLWITENTPHCGTYFVDREEYVHRVAGFFGSLHGVLQRVDHEHDAAKLQL
jgi:alpha-beta hydrolase superfamily lysophospholipase